MDWDLSGNGGLVKSSCPQDRAENNHEISSILDEFIQLWGYMSVAQAQKIQKVRTWADDLKKQLTVGVMSLKENLLRMDLHLEAYSPIPVVKIGIS